MRLPLLGDDGNPLDQRVETVLHRLVPRIKRQFPALQDDVSLVDVLEEAGRRIVARERRSGPLVNFYGYAWVTIRSVAISRMRRRSVRMLQNTLQSEVGERLLNSMPSPTCTAEDIERRVLLQELLATLPQEERLVLKWKASGISSELIASRLQRTVSSVDTIYFRAKGKLRRLLDIRP